MPKQLTKKAIKANEIYIRKQKLEKQAKRLEEKLAKRIVSERAKYDKLIEAQKSKIQKKYDEKLNRRIVTINKEYKERKFIEREKVYGRIKKKKPPTTAKLKKKLYTAIQLYARLRDTNINWVWPCISCWKMVRYDNYESDWWHYIPRNYMFTAFDERNINIQCKRCNDCLKWNSTWYREWIIEKYWEDVLKELESNKSKIRDWKHHEIEEKLKYYNKENIKLKSKIVGKKW